jgi:hypothetical protein
MNIFYKKYSFAEFYGNNKLRKQVQIVMGTVIDTYTYTAGPKTSFLIIFGPLIIFSLINFIIAFIASKMAKNRGLLPVPAFFAGFFASFVSLFFIAMFPKKENLNDMQ